MAVYLCILYNFNNVYVRINHLVFAVDTDCGVC